MRTKVIASALVLSAAVAVGEDLPWVFKGDGTELKLIPYGCTRLRMTMFPERR